jgi:hypothetical protein
VEPALLYDCGIVQNVIVTLSDNKAISTIRPGNTGYGVAAGGFEGVTDPSYVFRVEDPGPAAASAVDIFVLDNALGYALNQGGTAQFGLSYDPTNPYTSPLAYAVVTFQGYLTGEEAQKFFNYLGTIDKKLWSGKNAGLTQIALKDFGLSNSMLFLIGNVSTSEFTSGIYRAVATTPGTTYSPLQNGTPTTATAGAASGWGRVRCRRAPAASVRRCPRLMPRIPAFSPKRPFGSLHLLCHNLVRAIECATSLRSR